MVLAQWDWHAKVRSPGGRIRILDPHPLHQPAMGRVLWKRLTFCYIDGTEAEKWNGQKGTAEDVIRCIPEAMHIGPLCL